MFYEEREGVNALVKVTQDQLGFRVYPPPPPPSFLNLKKLFAGIFKGQLCRVNPIYIYM